LYLLEDFYALCPNKSIELLGAGKGMPTLQEGYKKRGLKMTSWVTPDNISCLRVNIE
jgi:hypothetical protein